MNVTSTVNINMDLIRRLSASQITALEQTAEALHTDVIQSQVIPRDTGALQNESTFVDYSESGHGRVSIISSTPYARRLYYHPEYKFSHDENPNAKGKWYDDYLDGGKKEEFCRNAFATFYRNAGGI